MLRIADAARRRFEVHAARFTRPIFESANAQAWLTQTHTSL